MTTPFNAALVGAADGDPSRTPNVPLQRAYGGTGNTTGAPSGSGTAPVTPNSGDLWYDTANGLWKQWNGAGWQLADAASPALGYRPPDIPLADILFAGQGGGFSPAFSGSGAAGSNNDTVNFVLGTFGVNVTTGGAGANTKISGTFGQALNLTGKCPVIWVKLAGYAHFLGGYPRLYLGDTGLANCWYWKLTEAAGQPWALDGEWLRVTLPFGTATQVGSPSRSSLAAMTLQVFDDSAGQVSVYLGGLATMTEPAQWPNGVVSFCFDDGYISQFQTAKPYLDKYGYRGTAYLITETLWNHSAYAGYLDLPSAQALEWYSGWEIAAHAYTAANHNAGYVSIGQNAALADMQAAKSYLRDQGFKAVEQFAYPLGVYDAGTLANTRRLFGSGRTISSVGGFPDETFPPADLTRLRAVPVSANSVLATIESYVTAAQANKEWLILVFHDIQTSASGNLQFSTANFQALADFISASGAAVAPVSEVLRASPKPSAAVSDYTVIGTSVSAGSTGRPADAGHVHADPNVLPADVGLVAWTFPPEALWTVAAALVSGVVYLAEFWVRSQQTISNITVHLNTLGSTLTSGQCFAGIYDSSGTLRGITADQSAVWASPGTTGIKTMALTTPYSASPGRYYVGFVANGTTGPVFRAGGSTTVTWMNTSLSGANLRFATNGSGTTLTTPLTLSSNSTTNAQPFGVLLS